MDESEFKVLQEVYRKDAQKLIDDANNSKNKNVYYQSKPFYYKKKRGQPESKLDAMETKSRSIVDGWTNLFTGLGTKQDKTTYTSFHGYSWLDDRMLAEMWVGDGYAKKISKVFADDATREWVKIKNDTDNEIFNKLDKLKAYKNFNLALLWQRHFGGSLVIMGINDGGKLEDEVQFDKIKSVDYLRVYDRVHVYLTNFNFLSDPNSKNYGEPEFYTIMPKWSAPYNVHRSRVLVFKGLDVPDWMQTNRWWFWGMSVLQPIWTDLKNLSSSINHVVKLLYEFVVGKIPIKNLAKIMAENDWEGKVRNAIDIIDLGKSIINAQIYDADSPAPSRESVGVAGLPDLLDRFMMFLSGVSEIPVTKLFGRSAAGMNSTGDGDQSDYYDGVKSYQKNEFKGPIQELVNIINVSKEIIKKVDSPIVEFNPLKQLTETEQLANKKTQAEIDHIYIQDGVYGNDECRKSRFENGYSYDTDIEIYDINPNMKELEEEVEEEEQGEDIEIVNPEEGDNNQINQELKK